MGTFLEKEAAFELANDLISKMIRASRSISEFAKNKDLRKIDELLSEVSSTYYLNFDFAKFKERIDTIAGHYKKVEDSYTENTIKLFSKIDELLEKIINSSNLKEYLNLSEALGLIEEARGYSFFELNYNQVKAIFNEFKPNSDKEKSAISDIVSLLEYIYSVQKTRHCSANFNDLNRKVDNIAKKYQ